MYWPQVIDFIRFKYMIKELLPDGSLKINDFDMASFMNKGERGLKGPLDTQWFTEAIAVHHIRSMKGKLPSVFLNHTSKPNSKIIGKIISLKFEDNLLKGDILIEDKVVADKINKGLLQSRSIEFNYDHRFIAGVAFLEENDGHFEEELSPISLEDVDFGKITLNQLKYQQPTTDITMTKEEIQLMIDTAVKAALESAKSVQLSYDPAQEREKIAADVKAEVEKPVNAKLAELEMELAINKLQSAKVPFTANQVKRKLAEFSTKGEKDLWVELQIEKFSKGTLSVTETEDLSPETYLAKEYDAQGGMDKLGFSKQDYVALHLESTKSIWDEIKKDLK